MDKVTTLPPRRQMRRGRSASTSRAGEAPSDHRGQRIGKTTLMLMGRAPSGTWIDPGTVGLGKLGGTAVVLRHRKARSLGTRVADDVVWGLPRCTLTLICWAGRLRRAERDTGSPLSGVELQRLALAARWPEPACSSPTRSPWLTSRAGTLCWPCCRV